MSRLAPTRAASAAQPRGAAALRFVFIRRAHDFRLRRDDYSFICAHTPAHWQQVILWARQHSGAHGPGEPVLWFYAAAQHGTNISLISLGSTVPFYGPSRDARTGAGARTSKEITQNHRTIEPEQGNHSFSKRCRFSNRFCGSEGIKYGVDIRSCASLIVQVVNSGLETRGARRKFRGSAGGLGRSGARGLVAIADLGNGGFLRFFAGRTDFVGMVMLECHPESQGSQSLGVMRRQPAGLAGSRRKASPGAIAWPTPLPPPCGAPTISMGEPQPVGRIWTDLRNPGRARLAEAGQSLRRANGSGLGCLPLSVGGNARSARRKGRGDRVRDRGASCGLTRRAAGSQTLWGAPAHVN